MFIIQASEPLENVPWDNLWYTQSWLFINNYSSEAVADKGSALVSGYKGGVGKGGWGVEQYMTEHR